MEEKLAIKLKIIDRYYPLRIDWQDEEKLREASRRINDVVDKYRQRYNDKDNQDFLAMATLQFVTRLLEFENNNTTELANQELQEVCNELDQFISNNS
jgi:cell division protein ZapA (FtsZ GTPase activity inhibitor)